MRASLIETLVKLAASDDRIMLLTADLGWSVVEPFARAYPRRFLNVGVAEQNMVGIATGLAQTGRVPYVYSIATFVSMRCYEQVRDGPLLHQLPVRLIGIGGGFAYGHSGPTHHALEDLAIFRALPGMNVVVPADCRQVRTSLAAVHALPGPAYLRVGKSSGAAVRGLQGRFAWNRPELVRQGRGVLFLCTGEIAHEAVRAADRLEDEGVSPAVAVLAHLTTFPHEQLVYLLSRFDTVVTVEEAYVSGGLGSLAAEAIAEGGLRAALVRCGVTSNHVPFTGSAEFLRRQNGLTAEHLAEEVLRRVLRRRQAV